MFPENFQEKKISGNFTSLTIECRGNEKYPVNWYRPQELFPSFPHVSDQRIFRDFLSICGRFCHLDSIFCRVFFSSESPSPIWLNLGKFQSAQKVHGYFNTYLLILAFFGANFHRHLENFIAMAMELAQKTLIFSTHMLVRHLAFRHIVWRICLVFLFRSAKVLGAWP